MGYFIIDIAASHITSNKVNYLKDPNIEVSFTQGGFILFSLSLDMIINKLLRNV